MPVDELLREARETRDRLLKLQHEAERARVDHDHSGDRRGPGLEPPADHQIVDAGATARDSASRASAAKRSNALEALAPEPLPAQRDDRGTVSAPHCHSVGELVTAHGAAQPRVSNHLACLRWCGFVEARREHRTVFDRLADERVTTLVELGHALLADNAEHVAACRRIDAPC
jgi:DNA-binding transcriptional ArsR family regulator